MGQEMETIGELIITGLTACFLFVGLHYFPWRRILNGKENYILEPPYSYICGVAGLGLIYSGLVINWWLSGKSIAWWMALLAFWTVIVGGGGAVIACYILDVRLETHAQAKDAAIRQQIEERRDGREWQ